MDAMKYVGMDVHKDTIALAVVNARGKVVTEAVIETAAVAVRDFFTGVRGTVHFTCEEGTHAAWLYDLLQPHVAEVVVRNPRQNKLPSLPRRDHQPCRVAVLSILSQLPRCRGIITGTRCSRNL
jgi:hypothetical protein